MMPRTMLLPAVLLIAVGAGAAEREDGTVRLRARAEIGFLAVLDHRIQLSKSGTYFDYRRDGGQDVLAAVSRFTLDLRMGPHHEAVLLYQPLRLETREIVGTDLSVDEVIFEAGTPVRFTYGFPFYRASYLYDFREDPREELAVGLSLQIRNATIEFESLDGEILRTTRDVGPVPALKTRCRFGIGRRWWWGAEADGMYAPVSYLNGSDEEVTGAILDASLRAGVVLSERDDAFLNLRYLGGGAVGTDSDETGPGDGYVKNWLHFLTVTVGASREF